jgi:hypothetical protein
VLSCWDSGGDLDAGFTPRANFCPGISAHGYAVRAVLLADRHPDIIYLINYWDVRTRAQLLKPQTCAAYGLHPALARVLLLLLLLLLLVTVTVLRPPNRKPHPQHGEPPIEVLVPGTSGAPLAPGSMAGTRRAHLS